MAHYKTITSIPGWADLLDGSATNRVSDVADAYARVPLFRRAVDLRCDALASVPISITSMNGDTEKDWPFQADLRDLIWKTENSLLLYGAGYWEKGYTSNVATKPKDVKWVNSNLVQVDFVSGEIRFKLDKGAPLTSREIVYFREFDPTQDVKPGKAQGLTALENARLLHYTTRMASKFFENGAIFPTLLNFDYPPDPAEAERVETWFKRLATGINNAFRVLALRSGKTSVNTLMSPVRDLAIPELSAEARHAIMDSFHLPQTMAEDAANFATATQHDAQFWETTIKPRAPLYESVINVQLLNPIGLKVVFEFEKMDVFQEDESERAGSLVQLTNAGVPLLLAMDILGYELDEEQLAILEAEKERKEAVSQEIQTNIANAQATPLEDSQDTPAKADLDLWEKKAQKRIKRGVEAACAFESENISPELNQRLYDSLKGITDSNTAHSLFDRAKTQAFYDQALRSAVRDFYNGKMDGFAFIDKMVYLITEQFTRAWNEGMRSIGLDPQLDMEEDWRGVLDDRITQEINAVEKFASDIESASQDRENHPIDPLLSRVAMWSNRYNELVNLSIATCSQEKLEWVLGPTEVHCENGQKNGGGIGCLNLSGVVDYAKNWREANVKTQGDMLSCGGFNCQCQLVPTKKRRTRGGVFSRLP